MRTVFFVLLLLNAALAAWIYWVTVESRRDGGAMAQQIEPDKIRLITAEEAVRMAAARKFPPLCIEWGAFPVADTAKALEALEGLQTGLKARERRVDDATRWWVMIPPATSRNAANNRVNELRKQGVEELYVMEDEGGYRNAISLGLFRSEEGAKTRLDALEKRGVKGARVVTREGGARVFLQLREASEGLRAKLGDLRATFPGVEVRDCPPG